ncbi:MAG TPA: ABC transporter substrate-binding protein [Candidatus Dormibacteraeota bacterium]|nr:ABC transporter substrate-binding protein [Candidatus Dormibacteraeota bacterium]
MRRISILATALALIVAACGGTAAPSASPAASASAAKTNPPVAKLAVSYSNIIGDELPLWIAKEGGYFDKNFIDAGELQNISSSNGVPALLSGQIQVAQLGGSEVLSANAQGGDLMVIGMLAGVYPFVFMARPEIKKIADLKGKSVGVSSAGSSSDIATRVGLKAQGLDPDKDVTIVAVGSAANRAAALKAGSIQGAVVNPPDTVEFEKLGFNTLFDMAAQKLPSANTAVVVKKTWLDQNKDVAQRYIDAIVQAWAREKKDKEFSVTVLKKYYKSTDDQAMTEAYEFFSGRVASQPPLASPANFKDAQETLGAKDPKVKAFDVSKMIDNSFVQNALDRGLDKQ